MNPSEAAAEALVDEIVRRGVRHVVLAPGSRSAPLAFAIVGAAERGDVRLHVRVDERSAAFTAVGLARVGGPVAVMTTSGTAVANLHPAVLEASHSGVPLVLLTADRPHELRGTGANQTTDQVHIFGSAVRFFADVPAPHGRSGEGADLRNLLGRALAAATGARSGDPGPVHLNLAFREPLAPSSSTSDALASHAGAPAGAVAENLEDRRRVDVHPVGHPASRGLELARDRHTVVVAGDGAGPAARECAEDGGFPLLAEPSSGARSGPNALGPYRLLLGRPGLGERVERVVVFGHATLSRPVGTLLARPDVEVIVVAPGGGAWPDAARNAARVVDAVAVAPGQSDGQWLAAWQHADRLARRAIDDVLDTESLTASLTGPVVAREVWAAQRHDAALVVGSSNPVRDLDLAAWPAAKNEEVASITEGTSPVAPLVLANRGLAGIDGTLSTAAGVSLASGRFTRVLLGDLAFLHDIGGLLVGPLEEAPRLQAVVVNDGGGGIFSLLEQGAATYSAVFERIFGTPHDADLASLCAGYGVRHARVEDLGQLRAALAEPSPGRSVVEVTVDRAGLRDLHHRIRAAVDAALT